MKKIVITSVFMAFLIGATSNVSAFWNNDNWECMGPFGQIPGCNPYDEWDPRYWMEEMEDMWDDNDNYYGGYGGNPYGGGYRGNPYGGGYGGYPYGGYGGNPYGGGYGGYMPQPYYPYAPPPAAAPAAPAESQ